MSDKDKASQESNERNANLITFEFQQLSPGKKSKVVADEGDNAFAVKNIIFPSVDFVDSPVPKKKDVSPSLVNTNSPARSMANGSNT